MKMSPLRDTHVSGLTYGQILSTLGILLLMFTNWVAWTNSITELKARVASGDKDRDRIEMSIQVLIRDNKEEHSTIRQELKENNKQVMDYLQQINGNRTFIRK